LGGDILGCHWILKPGRSGGGRGVQAILDEGVMVRVYQGKMVMNMV
jgi:hypothetical protein